MVLAADRRQARTVFRYIAGLLEGVPMLEQLIEGRTSDAIHLANRISIEVHTASFRAVRGYTLVAAVCDEVAFWRDESSANPDAEILAALRPGMATVRGAVLLGISSPSTSPTHSLAPRKIASILIRPI
jgi:phage terminase large subunit-like protein